MLAGCLSFPSGVDPGGATCAAATAFLARTSGLNATHTAAYIALICGLVADGIWVQLDMLHIYATQDSTTALLNLVSTSYNGTAHGSPTFTTDRGFTGVNGSNTVYIDTGFNASTATSPKFVRDSAHLSVWGATDTGMSTQHAIGENDATDGTSIVTPRYSDGSSYFGVNSGVSYLTVTNATAQGHYIANRDTSTTIQGYKNGSLFGSQTLVNSLPVANRNIYTIGFNFQGSAFGSNIQAAEASIGSSLSATDVTNFYNRLRTYMTAVGVP